MSAGVEIKRRSRVPGVIITQYVEQIPPGKSTPDFMRKPMAVNIQEGKLATFKAVVSGEPKPTITWARNKGDLSDPEKYNTRYDEKAGEYILQILNVTADQADTYKCFATNSFGRAVCTASLKVIEAGFRKNRPDQNEPEDFRKMLKKTTVVKKVKAKPKKEGEVDPKFWEVLLSAQKKDYERVCQEFGITDYRWMLKRLNQMKKEREEKQEKYVEKVENMKQIEVKPNGKAEFELDMKLKNPKSKIYLYKNGETLDYGDGTDDSFKHNLKKVGDKYTFTINNVGPEDSGLYQVNVEEANMFSTELDIADVEFDSILKDVTVVKGKDATFDCVLSDPVSRITWYANDASIEPGDKYNITVSEDMLTHRLVVKNCRPVDNGTYTVIAGIKSSKAALTVKDDPNALQKGQRGTDNADKLGKEQARKLQGTTLKTSRGAGSGGSSLGDGIGRDGIMGSGSGQEGKGRGQLGKDGLGEDGLLGDGSGKDGLSDVGSGKDGSGKDGLSDVGSGKDGSGKDGISDVGSGKDGSGKGGSGKDGISDAESGKDGSGKDGFEVTGLQKNSRSGDGAGGDMTDGDGTGDTKCKKHPRVGQLVPDTNREPEVHFVSGLSDTAANIGETAELSCTLSSKDCVGIWYKDGQKLESMNGITISKEGAIHKLIMKNCQGDNAGVYRFEAEGRKSEATLIIKEPPKIDADAMGKFSEAVIIRAGENAIFKLPFSGKEPIRVQWFKDEMELLEGPGVRIERSSTQSRLLLNKCQRKDSGEVKIKLKNEFATTEATSKLVVLDKPTPPQGPVDLVESSLSAIEFKWRPPKDDGGCPVTNYILERQQVGRNTWTKIGDIPGQPAYRDTAIDRGRKYCYRIRAKNSEGISDIMETNDIAAGTLALPGQPASPKVVSAFKDCINLAWVLPTNAGGGSIIGYNLEKRKKGSNLWSQVNPPDEPIREKKYAVTDVMEGAEYEFRVIAINTCGPGEPSGPSDCVFARDPQKPPGKVKDLKVTDSSYHTLCLAWTKPNVMKGVEDDVKGYFVEIRPTDQIEWSRCNTNAIVQTSFTVTGLKSLAMYWVRVIATNEGGEGHPQEIDKYIIAMPPPVKPKFTDRKMKNFMVVKAGNTVRATICFEASPLPDITWLKDNMPLAKHVTITNSEKVSQLLIPTSDRSDSGIYTIIVKNIVGQETFSVEIRITDEPKPPGAVQLEQNVEGTLTLNWTPSPDEKRDDRLHYMVMQRDSVKRTWWTVADHLFNHRFTTVIVQGREYYFRVYAKNDMGLSEPSESPTWGAVKKKGKLIINQTERKNLNFQSAPRFTVPLKLHIAPKGYECYMSCAVSGNPTPHITWYHNNVSLNTNTNYLISNTCGVCSMLILMVGPKDTGDYKVVAENPLGQAETSTKLTVRE
ncbi:immunoglobulin-like and fibronectin type III domain-containing protein 1 isoform X1 [Ictalurus punctatus]|uniref:immunoglobulin-like and fibronectin type III domain-containing protein 1 isoform X1 n=1 Tax=Ictalurus punctatus TaxID=7998 RepID=UPI000802A005|nr:immunoglobulin-like and fibronectin type III domain-containing protein 1 isoform X1 [Ictalurus punctatus]XP_017334720.1 immunoglobulin-like and fibronectin type III domain-containing protein 1 isoform X1 [Ictalurus punctatus]